MKNLLALVGLVVVGFVGAGWYFGWYKFSEQTDSQGHIQLKVNVDANKIKQDGGKLEKAIETVGQQKGGLAPTQSQPPVPPGFQTNTNYGSSPPPPPPSPPQVWEGQQVPLPQDVQVPPIQFPPPPPGLPGGGKM